MGRFRYNLSDGEARQKHVKAVNLAAAARQEAIDALDNTFDPEAGKTTDNPFPEVPENETPVVEPSEAPAEEAAAEEESATPVRKCSVCREPGHTKRDCPTLVESSAADAAGVSETHGDDNNKQQQEPA